MNKEANLIWEKWIGHLEHKPDEDAIIHIAFDQEPYHWTYKTLIESALRVTLYLQDKGVKRGDVCGIILRHNKYFYPIYLGASLLGTITTVLAYKNPKLHPEKFVKGLEGMSKKSGLDWVLTEEDSKSIIQPIVSAEGSTIKDIFCPLEIFETGSHLNQAEIETLLAKLKEEWKQVQPSDPFLLQHSSGTTGLQKGVTLSHKAILKHADYYGEAIALSENDKIISWLPLYHDMGLIAAYTVPLIKGVTTVQIDPFDWIMEPVMLMEAVSKYKGTLMWLPNFAYLVLSKKVHADDIKGLDLSSLRMVINCSEPVSKEAHDSLYGFYMNNGFTRNALGVSYAMAETTYAITQTEPGKEAKILYTDKAQLAQGKVVLIKEDGDIQGRYCVSSGKPINGCEIRVISASGEDLPEGSAGEIVISSESLFDGYRNNKEKSEEVLSNGWFTSGDIGFMYEGECYIIGRKKDIIIVAGKNIYPEDVEAVVNKVDGVIPGRVVAFGIYDDNLGTDQINVAVETELPESAHKDLAKLIMKNGVDNELSIASVHIKPSRWLIKSSSGKLSRNDNKMRILAELN